MYAQQATEENKGEGIRYYMLLGAKIKNEEKYTLFVDCSHLSSFRPAQTNIDLSISILAEFYKYAAAPHPPTGSSRTSSEPQPPSCRSTTQTSRRESSSTSPSTTCRTC